MKFLLAIALLLISVICSAAIYMQSNTDGQVTYSDMPSQDSKVMNVQDAPTTQFSTPATQAPKTTTTTTTKTTKTTTTGTPAGMPVVEAAHAPYSSFAITSPTDQQTFQNQREIPVSLNVTPNLQKGDRIGILVDGQSVGEPAPMANFVMHQLSRGTHQVSAVLVDANNSVLRQAGPVTFFVHYAALGGGGGG
jgi:hypothetical protein